MGREGHCLPKTLFVTNFTLRSLSKVLWDAGCWGGDAGRESGDCLRHQHTGGHVNLTPPHPRDVVYRQQVRQLSLTQTSYLAPCYARLFKALAGGSAPERHASGGLRSPLRPVRKQNRQGKEQPKSRNRWKVTTSGFVAMGTALGSSCLYSRLTKKHLAIPGGLLTQQIDAICFDWPQSQEQPHTTRGLIHFQDSLLQRPEHLSGSLLYVH